MVSTEGQSKKTWTIIRKSMLTIYLILNLVSLRVYAEKDGGTPPKLCTSNECLRSAANLKLSMDFSVDPCEDFYEYACGKWDKEHPNVELDSSYDAYDSIDDKISVATKNILTRDRVDGEPRALEKSKNFYWACKDMDARNALGLTSMNKYLKKVKLPVLPNFILKTVEERENYIFNWMKSEALIKKYFKLDVFIGASVTVDAYNVSQKILSIGSVGAKCPLSSPGYPEEKDEEVEQIDIDSIEYNITSMGNFSSNEEVSEKLSERNIIKTKMIKYVLREAAINITGEIPEDSVLQEAVDVILEVEDAIQEVGYSYY
ncbi:hypothetical protein JTB14_003658 [Gonioctena quinquepunctata]|nr:hypothetical protein JTB14_003658 [Gonioctena quinquepunctata]